MIKRLLANTIAKKTSIFVAVFAITCIIMGARLGGFGSEDQLLAVLAAGQATRELIPTVLAINRVEHTAIDNYEVLEKPSFPTSGEYPIINSQPLTTLQFNIPKADGFVYCASIPLSQELQRYTYDACVQQNLDYELVLALMWRESRFTVNAVGQNANGTKDSGIMQINDVNKPWLLEKHGITDLLDPKQNIYAGTTMLGTWTAKYGMHDALMAYQYGEEGMKRKISSGVTTNDSIQMLLKKRSYFISLIEQA